MPALQTTIDPLHAFVAGAFVARTPRPLPLIATQFDVVIDAGLAIVTTTRTFRNAEDSSIEATITFPLPVHATLFALTARIANRVLEARARRKTIARADYESAIDRGQTAVLHEEVLRGVHMLSVAHVPPDAEVEVRTTWALTLTNIDGRGRLHIPLTVGDIYGRSALPESDDLVHGGRADTAALRVTCRDGTVTLRGGDLSDGRADIPLDAPIDLEVSAWTPRELRGRAADGRDVVLRIAPAPSTDTALDVAILVDRSGSMSDPCSAEDRGDTKHHAVLRGLRMVAGTVAASDAIDLWEFDNALDHIGSTAEPVASGRAVDGASSSETLLALIRKLRQPHGGTEIGVALAGAIAQSRARDFLLITDGKSHALDVQQLARAGRRICVVLVGEDSLEANVGHLSALTGGEIFVTAGNELTAVLKAALLSLRMPFVAPEPVSGIADHVAMRRGGMIIEASWRAHNSKDDASATPQTRAVAAVAASLLLPTLTEDNAAALAEAEGLVTHLTSLVLVDDAGAIQDTVPATRKIPLPSPRVASASVACAAPPPPAAADRSTGRFNSLLDWDEPSRASLRRRAMGFFQRRPDTGNADRDPPPLPRIPIDWDQAPQQLQSGDLSSLDADAVRAIREAATNKVLVALAATLQLDPVVVVVGLLAHAAGPSNRTAARIARAIFTGDPLKEALAVARLLRLT